MNKTDTTFEQFHQVVSRQGVMALNSLLGHALYTLRDPDADPRIRANIEAENTAFLPFLDDLDVVEHIRDPGGSKFFTGCVFRFQDRYFRYTGSSNTWGSLRIPLKDLKEVAPRQKTITVFEEI